MTKCTIDFGILIPSTKTATQKTYKSIAPKKFVLISYIHFIYSESYERVFRPQRHYFFLELARRDYSMKMETLNKRLDRNRPMTSVTIRMPEDVIEDLKKVAPLLGFSGYQPLIRAYIGQGLRVDLERFESETVNALIESLKRRGVSEAVIDEALDEVAHAASNS
jgi:predicted DNA binding CopG/RHH family protein